METKFTPGPWNAIKGDTLNPDRQWGVSRYLSREACEEIDGADAEWPSRTEVLAEVTDGPTSEADAQLIAAAPAMYAALATISLCYDGDPYGCCGNDSSGRATLKGSFIKALEDAQAAIAKATGQTVNA
jgi:hypothetical protein